ncbi:hypothetical protein HLB01_09400 [Bordetella trematum]|uniref:hypothetical protein n=1 Tax=Bordetella trematum TaxID=123899 RepID=UPI000F8D76D4|nr:hypothetical protein [Bordetella trematum]NNH19245.1 hypothetical protein [Bordetella trematum]
MQDIEKFIKYLVERDITFLWGNLGPQGWEKMPVSPEELPRYLSDPPAFLAQKRGVLRQQYLDWHDSNFNVYCAGRTKAGKPCKNLVPGGGAVSPARWVEMQGGFCSLHC